MSRLLDGMPYTPAVATDIRRTFAKAMQVDEAVEWRCRVEGAREVMRSLGAETNVKRLPTATRISIHKGEQHAE